MVRQAANAFPRRRPQSQVPPGQISKLPKESRILRPLDPPSALSSRALALVDAPSSGSATDSIGEYFLFSARTSGILHLELKPLKRGFKPAVIALQCIRNPIA